VHKDVGAPVQQLAPAAQRACTAHTASSATMEFEWPLTVMTEGMHLPHCFQTLWRPAVGRPAIFPGARPRTRHIALQRRLVVAAQAGARRPRILAAGVLGRLLAALARPVAAAGCSEQAMQLSEVQLQSLASSRLQS
jgi:hypothetical protein